MVPPSPPALSPGPANGPLARALGWVERVGNRVPDPLVLFVGVGLLLWLAAALLQGAEVRHPATGAPLVVRSLLEPELLRRVFTDAVANFVGFPPLGIVLVVMMGIGVAERSGLFASALGRLVHAPPRLLTALLLFAGVSASIASDAGFVVVVPLGAALFAAAGRDPLVGLAVAFAGVSGGFSANLLITALDPLLAGLTQAAAQLVEPGRQVAPTANWLFMAASVPLLVGVGVGVTRWVEGQRRPGRVGPPPEAPQDGPALRRAGLAALAWVGVVVALALGPLRSDDGGLGPLFASISVLIAAGGLGVGVVYGRAQGTLADLGALSRALTGAMEGMASYLVLAFVAAQVIAWFGWTGLGVWVAVRGAEALAGAGLGGLPALVGFMAFCAALNLLIASASAKWALLAPVFVPMLLLLGHPPELTQAAYRVADSSTNVISPLMPYLPVVLACGRRYDPTLGVGTLLALMLPYAVGIGVCWSLLLLGWAALGLPLGVG